MSVSVCIYIIIYICSTPIEGQEIIVGCLEREQDIGTSQCSKWNPEQETGS